MVGCQGATAAENVGEGGREWAAKGREGQQERLRGGRERRGDGQGGASGGGGGPWQAGAGGGGYGTIWI